MRLGKNNESVSIIEASTSLAIKLPISPILIVFLFLICDNISLPSPRRPLILAPARLLLSFLVQIILVILAGSASTDCKSYLRHLGGACTAILRLAEVSLRVFLLNYELVVLPAIPIIVVVVIIIIVLFISVIIIVVFWIKAFISTCRSVVDSYQSTVTSCRSRCSSIAKAVVIVVASSAPATPTPIASPRAPLRRSEPRALFRPLHFGHTCSFSGFHLLLVNLFNSIIAFTFIGSLRFIIIPKIELVYVPTAPPQHLNVRQVAATFIIDQKTAILSIYQLSLAHIDRRLVLICRCPRPRR